jgi:hypothetical protein
VTRSFTRDLRAALPGWIVARVIVFSSLGFAHLLERRLKPLPIASVRHIQEGILGWDAVRYEQIARFGYEALPEKELRFFPLLPVLARGLGTVLGGRYGLALLLIASASALVFGALLHRIVLDEKGDAAMARWVTWVVALVPPAFVLVWGYSEALAGALLAAGFLALRRQWWWAAAGAGLLLGLTRPVGLLFVLPAAIEAARGFRIREAGRRVAAVVSPVVGCALYLAWVSRAFGDAMLPFDVQRSPSFRGPAVNPFPEIATAVANAFTGRWEGNALHVPWVALVLVLVVVSFRRWPLSYAVFGAATVLTAISANRWGSFERYSFLAVPILLAVASSFRTERSERTALAIGSAAMAIYGTLAIVGAYVP